ncbi:hypothetical protein IT568_12105 [bacterium]|nr:hypothetical protein [bacterium]
MPTYVEVLKIVHVIAMATWFGLALSLPSRTSEAVENGREIFAKVFTGIARSASIVFVASIVTLLSGFLLIFARFESFSETPVRIFISLGITLLIFLITFTLTKPSWNRILRIFEDEKEDFKKAIPHAKFYYWVSGFEHFFMSVVIVFMLWQSF